MTETNRARPLAFDGKYVKAEVVQNVRDYKARGVVTNLSNRPMRVGGEVPGTIPPWKSTIMVDGIIASADLVSIVAIPDDANLGGVVFDGWDWFGNRFDKFPRTTPLYISPHDVVGQVRLNPYAFSNAENPRDFIDNYDIRLNLWWAPAKTDCFLHNEHPFLEIHTQIFGQGRIQICHERDVATLYREITTAVGDTHDPLVRVTGDREFAYPWHRGWTDTDAIWMAIELHPAS
ncbi:MAG: hypothetical protein JWR51_230 [Devosia sp.]|uniref:hypothetical protein n=1 Tax=Devosia sp. TaxID=1871048 RepID=UPI00261B57A0|nr:hypothetical protein [Devosia sp.]MDB5527127.1 hypothetical protein [Devosia sp.]